MYTVYEHISPDGKRYIGKTGQEPERRWRKGEGYIQNKRFYEDIRRFGWDSFQHNIISKHADKESAADEERRLISLYGANDPGHGYNISGGDGAGAMAESTKALLSKSHKGKLAGKKNPMYGRTHTEAARKLISEKLKDYYTKHDGPRRGAGASEETRRKLSESRRGSAKAQKAIEALNRSKAKTVICIETGIVYSSTHDVERKTGYRQGNIAAACRGAYAQAYGYHWEYV